jgi:hypothetical protein
MHSGCAFNARGSRVIIVVVQIGAEGGENICWSGGGGSGKRKDKTKLSLLTKIDDFF